MSFWDRLKHAATSTETTGEAEEQRQRAKDISDSKQEYYEVMKRFAIEAGDEDSVRFYEERLRTLKRLQHELDVLMGSE